MRAYPLSWVWASSAASRIVSGAAAEVLAEPPSDLIVTVYRAPYRESGSIDLDDLNGFALVTETRLVRLPAGVSRVRFEGVADGIEPSSALITGLPGQVIEKNRDARLLSPSALIASAVGKPRGIAADQPQDGQNRAIAGHDTLGCRGRRRVQDRRRALRPCAVPDCRKPSASNQPPISRRGRPCRSRYAARAP